MRVIVRVSWFAVIGVCLLTAGSSSITPSLQAQGQPYVFLSLTDKGGAPITDLKGTEVVFHQGAATCLYVRLEPITWPMKLTVMADNGIKMGDQIQELRGGLRAFFAGIPSGVEMSLITTSPQPRWIVRPTTDRDKLLKGVDLISPDRGSPKFVDALLEAADRIDKDKSDNFPVLVAIASELTEGSNAREQDIVRMLDRLVMHPATAHVIMLAGQERVANGLTGALQQEVGTLLAKQTGGTYAGINSSSRFATLLPDLAQRIARSQQKQSHQYRVSCDRWDGPTDAKKPFSIGTTRQGATGLSTPDGHVP